VSTVVAQGLARERKNYEVVRKQDAGEIDVDKTQRWIAELQSQLYAYEQDNPTTHPQEYVFAGQSLSVFLVLPAALP
jgi:hypothetical protein